VPDVVPDTARRLDDLLAEVKHADEAIAEARAGAVHAGDPDPYRTPAEEPDEGTPAS
jgi:ribosome-binding factor A